MQFAQFTQAKLPASRRIVLSVQWFLDVRGLKGGAGLETAAPCYLCASRIADRHSRCRLVHLDLRAHLLEISCDSVDSRFLLREALLLLCDR